MEKMIEPSLSTEREDHAPAEEHVISKRRNMFIVSLTYKSDLEEVDRHLDAHVDYLKQEYAEGNFIASGRKIPRTGGIILSCVKNKDELELILAKDPFYKAGIAEYDIIEFDPSMVAQGFEILQK
jgi:uncharacterized protein YciI